MATGLKILLFTIVATVSFSWSMDFDTPTPDSETYLNNSKIISIDSLLGAEPKKNDKKTIFSRFLPIGAYPTGSQTTKSGILTTKKSDILRIQYIYNNDYWGASFQDPTCEKPWSQEYSMEKPTSKLIFSYQLSRPANFQINAFGNAYYGSFRCRQYFRPQKDQWITRTIHLKETPKSFNTPMNIIMDFNGLNKPMVGDTITLTIKDIRFE